MQKAIAYIQSLNKGKIHSTEVDEVTILEKIGDNLYKCNYKGTICTGIFNWFTCSYYVDDVYGIIKE